MRVKTIALLVVLGGILLAILSFPLRGVASPNAASTAGPFFVRGFVVAGVFPASSPSDNKWRDIYLPGAQVFLVELGSNAPVTSDLTDLSGRFTFKLRAPGAYRISARVDGFIGSCFDQVFEFGSRSTYAGNLRLIPERRSDAAAIFGQVSFRDGKRPRLLQPLLGMNAFARVDFEGDNGRACPGVCQQLRRIRDPRRPGQGGIRAARRHRKWHA